jgi:MFS family permease
VNEEATRAAVGAASAAVPAASAAFSDSYRRYALGLLLIVYVVNFLDRSILNILLQPIKDEFHPSDAALGFLSGPAFAVFYATLGVPIARWADRGTRRDIIALALFLWSGMTALCGLARTFPQLALARIGVGVGEAGCSPPAHSLISDYYPPEKRATAFATYALGIPIGTALGYLLGGWMTQELGWRHAFLLCGIPGLLLALIVRVTLREPPRGMSEARREAAPMPGTLEVARTMWGLGSFRHLAIAATLHAFVGYGVGAWNPSYLARSHGLSSAEIGAFLALAVVLFGGAGTWLGGYLTDRWGRRDVRWSMWVPGISTLIAVPFAVAFYLWPDVRTALFFGGVPVFFGAMYLGPTYSITQALAPLRMRAMASAFLLFLINLIGLGLGPQLVGVVSDLLSSRLGEESLRWALVLTVAINVWSGVHYFLGARTLRVELDGVTTR